MKTIQMPVQTSKTVIINNMDSLNEKFNTVMNITYSPYKRLKIQKIQEFVKNCSGINNSHLFVDCIKKAYISMMRLACGDTVERENITELAEMMVLYFMGNNESLVQEYIDPDFYINYEIQSESFSFEENRKLYYLVRDVIQHEKSKMSKEEVTA